MIHTNPPPSRPVTRYRRVHSVPLLLCGLLLLNSGCAVLGVIAAKVTPPPTIPPKYVGLANQSVGIMVWADTGVEIDFPSLRLDVASSLQKKLTEAQTVDAKHQPQLQGMKFPYPAASYVRYQQEHPEIEGLPAVEIAPKLGDARLIYIEIEGFQTRSDTAVELFRGELTASLKVVEVVNGKAHVAYQEGGVASVFPPKAPAEGIPSSNDLKIYRGLVGEFTTDLAKRFISYQEEQ
jgi:hypothetical protein